MFSFEEWERSTGSQRRAFWAGRSNPQARPQPTNAALTYQASQPYLPGENTVIRSPNYQPGPRTGYQYGPVIPEDVFIEQVSAGLERWEEMLQHMRETWEYAGQRVREAQDAFAAVWGPQQELARLHAVLVDAVKARRVLKRAARKAGWFKWIDEE